MSMCELFKSFLVVLGLSVVSSLSGEKSFSGAKGCLEKESICSFF